MGGERGEEGGVRREMRRWGNGGLILINRISHQLAKFLKTSGMW